MRFRVPAYCALTLALAAALNAQTPVNNVTFPIAAVGVTNGYGTAFPGCTVAASVVVADSSVVLVSPLSKTFTGTSPSFSLTGLKNGSTTVTITYDLTGCTFPHNEYIDVLAVVVGPGAPVLTAGQTLSAPVDAEPVSASTGELFGHDEMADLSLGGPTGLEFRRYYGSFLSGSGVSSALGTNWMDNFDIRLSVKSGTATVTLFRGKTVAFNQSGSTWVSSSTERRPYQLINARGGGYQFLDPDTNRIHTFTSAGALSGIQDRNGNTITLTQGTNGPTQISDGLGRTLTFTYTGTNLTGIQDQSGRAVSFTYTNGLLTGFTDANGNAATFSYTSSGSKTGLMTTEIRPLGNKPFTQTFDSSGRVAKQTDAYSDVATLTYNSGSTTFSVAGGVTISNSFNSAGNMTAMSDPAGGSSSFSYDSSTHPVSTTDRLGNKTSATWDPLSGLPASYTDETGNTTVFTNAPSAANGFTFYDLATESFADGTTVSFARDGKGNVTSITDQAGNVRAATWTSNGWLATIANPAGGVYTFSYNGSGTLASMQSPSSDTTTFGYDSLNRLNLVTNPDGTTKTSQYDGLDNVVKAADERGNSFSAAFDANNNGTAVTDALSAATTKTYDADDRVTSVTDPLQHATNASRDPQRRLKSITNAAGNSVNYTYDNLNRVTSVVDAEGNGVTFARDAENRVTSVTDALSRTAGITYDAHGNAIGVTSPKKESFTFGYDALNRLISAADPLNRTTQYTLDPRGLLGATVLPGGVGAAFGLNSLGRVTSITDPVGNVWSNTFDNMGRLTAAADPLKRSSSFTYDSRQRLSTATYPVGTAQYSYDSASNPSARKYSDGTNFTYTWDADNRLSAANGIALSYDAAGRIVSSNGLTMTRDSAGRLASVTYAAGKTVTYVYNDRGLLAQVTDWVGGNTTFTYDAAGELTLMTLANGITQTSTWDADGRVLTIAATKGSTTVSSISLTRDALGRVTAAARSAANIPAEVAGVLALAYDGAAQTLGSSFDGLGRVTQDSHRAYVWDLASRLTSYTGSDGSASFTYDAMGQRLSRTSGGATQNYIWNYGFPLPVLSTVKSGSSDQTYYVWLPDGTLLNSISAADSSRRFYHFDESGSVVLLTDGSGAVTDSYAISIYGDTVTQTGSTANPFTWQGRSGAMREGATSMYYMRARYYDSGPARFLSRDPLKSRDAREINPYQFVRGNPVESADPSGRGGDNLYDPYEAAASAATAKALYDDYHNDFKPGNHVICSGIGAILVMVFFPGELPVLEADADLEYRELLARQSAQKSDQPAACDQGQEPTSSRSQWMTDYENTVTETAQYELATAPQVDSVVNDVGVDRFDVTSSFSTALRLLGGFLEGPEIPKNIPKAISSDSTTSVKTVPLVQSAVQQAEERDPLIFIQERGKPRKRIGPATCTSALDAACSLLDPEVIITLVPDTRK